MSGDAPAAPVVFLMGPTAAGKTSLAVHLAQHANCEIVSVDSALVYRQMDIGTAKPDAETLAQAPHRLIDILDPAERYSAGRFAEDARREIAAIQRLGKVPLLTGGTMLYFRVLTGGIAPLPPADAEVRANLDARAAVDGWPALHRELSLHDPAAAARIHPNDRQRIQRALEVRMLTGEALSELQTRARNEQAPWPVIRLAVAPAERKTLHKRIELRLNAMIKQGFVGEVEALFRRGDLDEDLPSMRAVGYRQMWEHVSGRCTLAEAREQALTATRALARRQLTWLRADTAISWLDSEDPSRYTRALEALAGTRPAR